MKTFFLDIEASSLGDNSYPIEIAWVDEHGYGESHLIGRRFAWTDWDPRSEAIHRISRELLDSEGIDPLQVANRVNEALRGARLISDNPQWDFEWMARLLNANHHAPIPVESFNSLLMQEIVAAAGKGASTQTLRGAVDVVDAVVRTEAAKGRHVHRALPDAMDMWLTVQQVRTVLQQRFRPCVPSTSP